MKDLLGDICGILRDFGGRERATQKERRGKERERARKRQQRERARLVPTSQSKEEGGNIQSVPVSHCHRRMLVSRKTFCLEE